MSGPLIRYSPGGQACSLGVQYKNPGPEGLRGPPGPPGPGLGILIAGPGITLSPHGTAPEITISLDENMLNTLTPINYNTYNVQGSFGGEKGEEGKRGPPGFRGEQGITGPTTLISWLSSGLTGYNNDPLSKYSHNLLIFN